MAMTAEELAAVQDIVARTMALTSTQRKKLMQYMRDNHSALLAELIIIVDEQNV